MIEYPNPEAVEAADIRQLADWYQHLPDPGTVCSVLGSPLQDYAARRHAELCLLDRIGARLDAMGGLDCLGNVIDELKAG